MEHSFLTKVVLECRQDLKRLTGTFPRCKVATFYKIVAVDESCMNFRGD